MKLVIQRVSQAKVTVDARTIGEIGRGFLILLGIKTNDTLQQADALVEKVIRLRVMSDKAGKMNLALKDVKGEVLVVSQFTLYSDTRSGNRPSFLAAAKPESAKFLYEYFVQKLRTLGVTVKTGEFGAAMKIEAALDGPVTIIIET